jgi:hypothetical protein
MASHFTYGGKNYGDTYALRERKFPGLNQSFLKLISAGGISKAHLAHWRVSTARWPEGLM